MPREKKQDDILDQVKEVEKEVKKVTLIKVIGDLKKMAREINELKEKSRLMLKEIGLSDADIKRVIDFVNEQSDVKLDDEDKKELRDEVRGKIKEEKEKSTDKIVKKIEKLGFVYTGGGNTYSSLDYNVWNNWSVDISATDNVTATYHNIGNDVVRFVSNIL